MARCVTLNTRSVALSDNGSATAISFSSSEMRHRVGRTDQSAGQRLLGPCRNPFRDRLWGLDVQEVTDVRDDFQRVWAGKPMSVVDLLGKDAAIIGTVELQQGRRDRLR